jgi:hypothetical protein
MKSKVSDSAIDGVLGAPKKTVMDDETVDV